MDKALCQACLANIYSANNQELDRLDLISSNFFLLSWYGVTAADYRVKTSHSIKLFIYKRINRIDF